MPSPRAAAPSSPDRASTRVRRAAVALIGTTVVLLAGCGGSDGGSSGGGDAGGGPKAAETAAMPDLGRLSIDGSSCPIDVEQARALLGQPVDQTQDDDFACTFATPGGIGAEYALSIAWDGDLGSLDDSSNPGLEVTPAPELGENARRYASASSLTVASGSAFPVGDLTVDVMVNALPEQADRASAVNEALIEALADPS